MIESDTVWSGEILVDDKVIVGEGATLMIAPGSRIAFRPRPVDNEKGGGRLIVFGRLVAQGTTAAPILFTSAAAAPEAGDWEGLRFENAGRMPSRLDFCIIEYAQAGINGRTSSLQVATSHFRANLVGVAARSGLTGSLFDCLVTGNRVGVRFEQNDQLRVVNCRIEGNLDSGIVCSGSSPIIQNTALLANGKEGIACLRGSSPLVEDNLVSANHYGVWAEMNSHPTILHNRFVENDTAIGLERLSFAIIEENFISHNRIGIYCHLAGYPHIHGNNIFENRELAIDLGTYQSIVVARQTPFERRAAMNLPAAGQGRDRGGKNAEISASLPREGLIDAYGNWWGSASLAELRSGVTNVSLFEDGCDVENLIYQDKIFPRDRVGFAGWSNRPIAGADRRVVRYSGVAGHIMLDNRPSAGARVHAYREDEQLFENEGLTFSAPAGPDGGFFLFLKPGRYRLAASAAGLFPAAGTVGPETVRVLLSSDPVVVEAGDVVNVTVPLRDR